MLSPRCVVLLVGLLSSSPAVFPATASSPESVVQVQLDAYNAHDMNAFLSTYADDVELFEHPAKLLAKGLGQMRERYEPRFKEMNLHATIVKRIVMGNVVVDHETVTRTFPEGTGALEAVAIYQVQDGKISKVWLLFGPKTLDAKR
jgi:hypothetical protein